MLGKLTQPLTNSMTATAAAKIKKIKSSIPLPRGRREIIMFLVTGFQNRSNATTKANITFVKLLILMLFLSELVKDPTERTNVIFK